MAAKDEKLGLIDQIQNQIVLTESGRLRGNQLVRAHRLWETFLVEELGLALIKYTKMQKEWSII